MRLVLLLIFLFNYSYGFYYFDQEEEKAKCFAPGKCVQNSLLAISIENHSNDCLKKCQESADEECQWFTYFPSKRLCQLFDECTNFIPPDNCETCVSGEKSCEPLSNCDLEGVCQGIILDTFFCEVLEDCNAACASMTNCSWTSFDATDGICMAFSTCPERNVKLSNFVSNEKDCFKNEDKAALVLIGGHGNDESSVMETEVLDINHSTNLTRLCVRLSAVAPEMIKYATGGILSKSKIVICGGQLVFPDPYALTSVTDQCFEMDHSGLVKFSQMTTKRAFAASIAVNQGKKLWVLGGFNDTDILKSTEYIEREVSYLGPDLPLPLTDHAIVSLNDSTHLLIGGATSDVEELSPKTYYFNDDDKQWIPGPQLNYARYGHSAALGTDFLSGKQFVAVAGGNTLDGSEIDDSVEILYLDSQVQEWIKGPSLPKKLSEHAMMTVGSSIYVIGGKDDKDVSSNSVFKLSCKNSECYWEKSASLMTGRYGFVVVKVPYDLLNCDEEVYFSDVLY